MGVVERIKQYIDFKGITNQKFEKEIGYSNGAFATQVKKSKTIGSDKLENILKIYDDINPEWLLTGRGKMIISSNSSVNEPRENYGNNPEKNKDLIPLYDDVITIGGTNYVADMSGALQPSDYINAGDWFRGSTAALIHYGDSMKEYPSGCILALKEIYDKSSFTWSERMWGQNFCIETKEFRITKRLQKGKEKGYVTAYSSNEDVYRDGTLIHQPIDIRIDDIERLFLVLGYVVREHSSSIVTIR